MFARENDVFCKRFDRISQDVLMLIEESRCFDEYFDEISSEGLLEGF